MPALLACALTVAAASPGAATNLATRQAPPPPSDWEGGLGVHGGIEVGAANAWSASSDTLLWVPLSFDVQLGLRLSESLFAGGLFELGGNLPGRGTDPCSVEGLYCYGMQTSLGPRIEMSFAGGDFWIAGMLLFSVHSETLKQIDGYEVRANLDADCEDNCTEFSVLGPSATQWLLAPAFGLEIGRRTHESDYRAGVFFRYTASLPLWSIGPANIRADRGIVHSFSVGISALKPL